jgi:glycosyltransferase involved in cell wall biosynthesis
MIANTRHMRDVLSSTLGIRAVVLHPPIAPAAPVTGGDAITLINLTHAKGSSVFWDLAAAYPDRRFIAVEGGYGSQDQREALPNVDVVEHGDLDAVWAQTRILLVPSEHESYSMVAAEAGARGIPVVASDLPGIREAAGHGALYTTSDWPAALTQADEQWDDLSGNALIHAACRNQAAELDHIRALLERVSA